MRKEFINAKYVDHKYARKTCSSAAAKMIELFEAVQSRDLLALIQVYAEGVELMEPLPEAGPVSPARWIYEALNRPALASALAPPTA